MGSKADSELAAKNISSAVKSVELSHSKSDTFVVDVSRGLVRVAKTSSSGIILLAGQAPFSVSKLSSQDVHDAQFATSVAAAIKQACSRAKISRFHRRAVFVVGDSYVVTKLFTWPYMPQAALQNNAKLEISSFLPQDVTQYIISCEIQRSYNSDEGVPVIDVLVAAIPFAEAVGIATAAKQAGITISRMDVRENARIKAVNFYLDKGSEPFKSYMVLDVSRPQIILTICLDGRFYEKRFFGSDGRPELGTTLTFSSGTAVDAQEETAEQIEKTGLSNSERFWGLSLSRFDSDNLISEIAAMIDFINYNQKDTQLEGLLLIDPSGKLLPKIETALNIPVHDMEKFVKPEYVSKAMYGFNVSPVLDACGAVLVSNQTAKKQTIDLKPKGFEGTSSLKILMYAAVLAVLVLVAVFGAAMPILTERNLQSEYDDKVELIEATFAQVGDLDARIEELDRLRRYAGLAFFSDPAADFLAEFPQALSIIPFIFEIDGITVFNITARGDSLLISGNVDDLYSFTELVEYIMYHDIVYNIDVVAGIETFIVTDIVLSIIDLEQGLYGYVEEEHWITNFNISVTFW